MMDLPRRQAAMLFFAIPFFPGAPSFALADDQHAIVHLLKSRFGTPDDPLQVEPVVVSGDHAIAGWVQGERGGRALLRRSNGEWAIHLCSGDGLKQTAFLEQTGIAAGQAKQMEAELAAVEAGLDSEILTKFASFDGTLMIGPDGQHAGHGSSTHGQ